MMNGCCPTCGCPQGAWNQQGMAGQQWAGPAWGGPMMGGQMMAGPMMANPMMGNPMCGPMMGGQMMQGPGVAYGPGYAPGYPPAYAPPYYGGLPTDSEIDEMIYDAIDADPLIPFDANIDVSVEAGTVYLRGEVPSKRIKHAAGDDAWWIPGVVDVHNDIVVTQKHRERGEPQTQGAQEG